MTCNNKCLRILHKVYVVVCSVVLLGTIVFYWHPFCNFQFFSVFVTSWANIIIGFTVTIRLWRLLDCVLFSLTGFKNLNLILYEIQSWLLALNGYSIFLFVTMWKCTYQYLWRHLVKLSIIVVQKVKRGYKKLFDPSGLTDRVSFDRLL